MIIICAVDDLMGMAFNHRRQSQDQILREKIYSLMEESGQSLWMNEYSKKQFVEPEWEKYIVKDNDFLKRAGKGAYCFVESDVMQEYRDKIEKIILFRWNRIYPADVYFDIDLQEWIRREQIDFSGSSHEKITMEVYVHA